MTPIIQNTELPHLGDDQPKNNPWEQDRLGYAAFCRRVAQTLIRLKAPDGYVIGLNGRWGSGKSTALNFIKSFIEKHNQESHSDSDKITVIEFRPWIVSGHQDVIAAFFKVLAESLGDPTPRHIKVWRWIFRATRTVTDPVIDAAANVGAAIDPSSGAASSVGSRVLKSIVSFFVGRFLAEPSLQKTYESLNAQLAKDGRRLIVTIDDLDRLQDEEVVAILQMVKTVGRLPNVVYILVYDRQIVGHAIRSGAPQGQGPQFIEKIIQQELELPQPGRSRLLAMLDQEISFIASRIPENERWLRIVMDGIYLWVQRPRDIVRLANALIFAWPSLENELDAADLVAMEGLRLFEPATFAWIRDNRDFMFSDGRFMMAQEDVLSAAVEQLKQRIPDGRQKSAIGLMTTLFPQRIKAFKGADAFGWGEAYADQVARRGISTPHGYDAYFSMQVASDRISNAAMIAFLGALDDEVAVEKTVQSYLGMNSATGSDLIGEFLEELQLRFKSRNRPTPTGALLNVLVRNGEAILSRNENRGMLSFSPAVRFGFLLDDILDGWPFEEAGERLVAACSDGVSAAVIADIYIDRGRELDIFDRGGRTSAGPRVSVHVFNRLGEIALAAIVSGAADGTLTAAPMYHDIIRSWSHLAGPEAPRAWVEENMAASTAFLVKLGRGLVAHTIGERRKSYSMRERPNPDIFRLEALRAAAETHLQQTDLVADDHALLTELAMGSQRFLDGSPAPVFPHIDDEE